MAVSISTYRDYELEARELVQQLLTSSLERIHLEQDQEVRTAWPMGAEFTVESGQEALSRMVQGWEVAESWKYCIDFLGQQDDLFCYCVRWSEPTRRTPVPKATASVYFYVLAHNSDSPVAVFYVLEGHRLVHRPGRTAFHEVWLRNIIDNKLAIMQSVSL